MTREPSDPGVVVLGRGRVGRTLAGALTAAGVPVTLRSARDEASFGDGLAPGALVLLAVPDGAIGATAERVAAALEAGGGTTAARPSAGDPRGALPAVVHLSGASGLDPLAPVERIGAPVGVLHPFAPFPEPRSPEFLVGVTFGIAGTTPGLLARLDALATAVGGVPREVAADGWVAYHAAGVVASNYLVVLAAQAAELLERAGFDRDGAGDALIPLMRGTLDNLAAEGTENALSGPLRRGDVGTVERHLEWLDAVAPDVAATYRALARPGIDLAIGTGLDDDAAAALRRAVDGPPTAR